MSVCCVVLSVHDVYVCSVCVSVVLCACLYVRWTVGVV